MLNCVFKATFTHKHSCHVLTFHSLFLLRLGSTKAFDHPLGEYLSVVGTFTVSPTADLACLLYSSTDRLLKKGENIS